MVFKKPAILLSSSAFNALACSGPALAPPSCPLFRTPLSHRKRRRRDACHRYYATTHDYTHPFHNDYYVWPEHRSPHAPPTPYQIFNQRRDEPYSKRRFYELVKIYHPDRNKHLEDPGNEEYKAILLERYRLVIAANAILADPEKRKAYDHFGMGWVSWRDSDSSHSKGSSKYKYTTWHRWRTQSPNYSSHGPTDQDPMYNATWEDWERWYRATQHARQSSSADSSWSSSFFTQGRGNGLYTNNYAFMSLVFVIAALGGIGQATRFKENTRSNLERANLVSEETSRNLIKARQAAQEHAEAGEDKRGRIKRVLRERESYGKEEFDGRALREGDKGLCASGLAKDRDEPRFWEKPPER